MDESSTDTCNTSSRSSTSVKRGAENEEGTQSGSNPDFIEPEPNKKPKLQFEGDGGRNKKDTDEDIQSTLS